MTPNDIEFWMRQAIELAENGRGDVEPNPMVGCLIIKNDVVIGQGFHEMFGKEHAEINALRDCLESPEGSTVIVTLEPCSHFGQTPPCCNALIDAKVSKVIIGHRDPNPRVDGGGIRELESAGIETQCGFLEDEIELQNAGFFKWIQHEKPWVIAKYAMTLDGNIAAANGSSKWISNEKCRAHVHELRGQVDAIITGSQTVLSDDPRLNARPSGPRDATKVVFDSRVQTPLDSQIVQNARCEPVILVASNEEQVQEKILAEKILAMEKAGVEVLRCPNGYIDRVGFVLEELGKRGMTNVMLEAGSRLIGEFFAADEIDELRTYIAPTLIGAGIPPNSGPSVDSIADGRQMTLVQVENFGGNVYTRCVRKKLKT